MGKTKRVTVTIRSRTGSPYRKGQKLKYLGGKTFTVKKVKSFGIKGLYDVILA